MKKDGKWNDFPTQFAFTVGRAIVVSHLVIEYMCMLLNRTPSCNVIFKFGQILSLSAN